MVDQKHSENSLSLEIDSRTFILEAEAVNNIRKMLLLGLCSYGEIERLENEQEIHQLMPGFKIPERLRVRHPTESRDTTGRFAAALLDLELACTLQSELTLREKVAGTSAPCLD
jgi:hypothetical protein